VRAPIPFGLKLGFTAWIGFWAPVYWLVNGPANFLWLCDFANFVTCVAIWRGSARLASSQLVGVAFIQIVWAADFASCLALGRHLIGGTEYMFDAAEPLAFRALSLFHLWSVPLLFWLCRRLGYDRRGLRLQVAITAALFVSSALWSTPEANLNWMIAPFGRPTAWPPLTIAAVGVPVITALVYVPTHLVLRRLLPAAVESRRATGS
jgi:hypothetical protein